jgi:RNA polymerase sporulation-specific sigma factor
MNATVKTGERDYAAVKADNDRFIEENLGLVHLCANRFRGKGIEYDDLYGAGCIGLIKAAGAFDTERGVKFSTYAVPVILGEIKRLFRDGGSIKVSRSVKELSLKLSKERERFILINGREATVSELAELAETNEEAVTEALSVSMPAISLTETVDDESKGQIDIAVCAPDLEMVDILSLRQALESLDKDDRVLLYLRYYKDYTQVQTAKALGMSQVQVSRREKRLLLQLRGFLLE